MLKSEESSGPMMELRKAIPVAIVLAGASALVSYGAATTELSAVKEKQKQQEEHITYQDRTQATQELEVAVLKAQLTEIDRKLTRIESKLDVK